MYFGGIDGGATASVAIILDEDGKILSCVNGPSTPLWLLTCEESASRINLIMKDAISKANLPKGTILKSLGMCISGSIDDDNNNKLLEILKSNYCDLSLTYVLKNDTFSPINTACKNGGIVLIAGTGSNCQYISKDNTASRCRGWGHLFGDEGSGYWIAQKAIKCVFDHLDNYNICPYSIENVNAAMLKYFKVNNRRAMMVPFYVNFEKAFIAGFCKVLAELARENKDDLCLNIFKEAGECLAKNIVSILPAVDGIKEIEVVCVGSVFKSWDLLKSGFSKYLEQSLARPSHIKLLKLTKPSAIGAALLGAKNASYFQNVDLSENCEVFHEIFSQT